MQKNFTNFKFLSIIILLKIVIVIICSLRSIAEQKQLSNQKQYVLKFSKFL